MADTEIFDPYTITDESTITDDGARIVGIKDNPFSHITKKPHKAYRLLDVIVEPASDRKVEQRVQVWFDGSWSSLPISDRDMKKFLEFMTNDSTQEIMKKQLRDITDHINEEV